MQYKLVETFIYFKLRNWNSSYQAITELSRFCHIMNVKFSQSKDWMKLYCCNEICA